MDIRRVTVIGAGYMGSGITQCAAQAGYPVSLVDLDPRALENARRRIEWSVGKLAEKGELRESVGAVLGRISTGTALDAARDADIVIEAVYEDIDVKRGLFAQLNGLCGASAIIGSNTSTIPITQLSEAVTRRERVIGTHFFGPVPMMPLVEIIPTAMTSPDVVESVTRFCRSIGKDPVVVHRDVPGFVVNRILGAMACEAIRLLEDGVATIEEVDRAMRQGINMRVGPLTICDNAGLDVCLNAFRVLYRLDPGRMPEPPELLARLVGEGKLGRKSGEGFYKYDVNGAKLGPAF